VFCKWLIQKGHFVKIWVGHSMVPLSRSRWSALSKGSRDARVAAVHGGQQRVDTKKERPVTVTLFGDPAHPGVRYVIIGRNLIRRTLHGQP
jgi:PhoPQ-activated pathogenicity-related protein